MQRISCKKAKLLMELRYDGALSQNEKKRLSAHLDGCAACRSYETDTARLMAILRDSRPMPSEALVGRAVSAVRSDASVQRSYVAPLPWYRHPALRVSAMAVLVPVIVLSLCLMPLLVGNRKAEDAPMETLGGTAASIGTDYAPENNGDNAPLYISEDGMISSFPWAYLMAPEAGGEPEGDRPSDTTAYGGADDTDTARPSDTEWCEAETMCPPEEPEDGGTLNEDKAPVETENTEYDANEGCGTEPYSKGFYVLSGEAVRMTPTVIIHGDAVWRGDTADGSSVTFYCATDGAYQLTIDGRLVAQGAFLGYKGVYILLRDRQMGDIALRFSMDGDHLQLEVADLWNS